MNTQITWKYVKPIKDMGNIAKFESRFCKIPQDLLECIKANNGGRPSLNCFDLEKQKEREFKALFSFNKDDVENIFDAQDFDTQINSKERVLFPFANDSFGNLFCLYNNKIVLWEHEKDSIIPVADTWSDFLRMLY